MKNLFIFKISRILLLIALMGSFLYQSSSGQDIIKLKSGKEMKVTIVSEGTNVIQYRDFEDPTGPVYTVKKDQVESYKYKKGNIVPPAETKDKVIPKTNEIKSPGTQKGELVITRRVITLDGQPQSSRDIKTLMDPYPNVLAVYEKGKRETTLSSTCLMGSLLTDLVFVLMEKPSQTQEQRLKFGIPLLSVSVGFIVAGAVFAIDGKKKVNKSVSMYNTAVRNPGTVKIDFGIKSNGVILSIRF